MYAIGGFWVFVAVNGWSVSTAADLSTAQKTMLEHRRPIVTRPLDLRALEAELRKMPRSRVSGAMRGTAVATSFLLTLSLSCSEREPSPAQAETSAPAQPANAAALYAHHCAVCHGTSGDGDGTLVLDRPARSFKQGGFSFGNTEEAIFRTVSSGIGGTPMPGFAQLLAEDERRAVARHVISLGPEQVPGPGFASVLAVGDHPVVVRGQFAPLVDGGPEYSRGLLVGNPDGLSYQYAADDLRLLAVRQGPFVDRKDWGERGGSPLEPLGRVIFLVDASGAPRSEWELHEGEAMVSLLGTRTDAAYAVLRYRIEDRQGKPWCDVEESVRAASYRSASGVAREFQLTALENAQWPVLRYSVKGSMYVVEGGVMVRGDDERTNIVTIHSQEGYYPLDEPAAAGERCRIVVEYLVLPDATDASFEALREEVGR